MCIINFNFGQRVLATIISMGIIAVQAIIFDQTPIILAANENTNSHMLFETKVKENKVSSFSTVSESTVGEMENFFGKGWLEKDDKVKERDIAAVGAFYSSQNAISTKFDLTQQKPLVVMKVGVGNTGSVGLSVVELYLQHGFKVCLVVLPRYKFDIIHGEMDDEWEKHYEAIKANIAYKAFLEPKDLRDIQASKNATTEILNIRNASIAELKKNLPELLLEEAKAVKNELDSLVVNRDKNEMVAIESFVGAGHQHPVEVETQYVVRYDLGETVGDWLNGLQSEGAFIGSLDLPCNTNTERGYFHVTKDGHMTVETIPNSYIPDFMVLIFYPRESLLALEGTDGGNVEYQFKNCALIYLTPFVDPVNMNVSMSECMMEAVGARCKELRYEKPEVVAFFEALKKAEEAFGSNVGFLKLSVPEKVVRTVSRGAGILRQIETESKCSGQTIDTKFDAKYVKETFLDFNNYANLFANKGNRLTHKKCNA